MLRSHSLYESIKFVGSGYGSVGARGIGGQAVEPSLILGEVGISLHINLVFLETLLVQIGSALDFAMVR